MHARHAAFLCHPLCTSHPLPILYLTPSIIATALAWAAPMHTQQHLHVRTHTVHTQQHTRTHAHTPCP